MTAVNGVNGVNKAAESGWKVGLINYAQKYLTAESFGCKINVSGTGLKKKQTFVLVQDPVEEVLYIRSHLGRYVSADKYGNVTCEVEEPDQTEKFVVEYAKDGSGKWAFKNQVHGNYLGGTDDSLKCFAKTVTDRELWTVQLSIHPQVHLRNVNRKRYAHVCEDQLQVTQTIPWGEKSLLFLDFVDGKYALKTYDSRYLNTTGELSPQLTEACKFTLEIRSGQNGGLAFRDSAGCYLTGVGATATMKGRNKTVGKDELFTLEDTHPQVVLIAYNGKKVSIKQGLCTFLFLKKLVIIVLPFMCLRANKIVRLELSAYHCSGQLWPVIPVIPFVFVYASHARIRVSSFPHTRQGTKKNDITKIVCTTCAHVHAE